MTPREQRFVEEYLIDLNAFAAAVRAGYAAGSAKSKGYLILRKPEVAAAVAAGKADRAERTRITADRVVRELGKIAFADVRQAVRWETQDGAAKPASEFRILDSAVLEDDVAAAIREIGQDSRGGLKVRLHDKQAALVALGRHLGMFRDRLEHTGSDGGPIEVTRIELVGPEG